MTTRRSKKILKISAVIGVFIAICLLTFIWHAKNTAYASDLGAQTGIDINGNVGNVDFNITS